MDEAEVRRVRAEERGRCADEVRDRAHDLAAKAEKIGVEVGSEYWILLALEGAMRGTIAIAKAPENAAE